MSDTKHIDYEWALMPASTELDAEIARRVFGKQPCDEWHLWHAARGEWMANDGHDVNAHRCYPSRCPVLYSQLIQAAWLVVEEMRARGLFLGLHQFKDGSWIVDFCADDDTDDTMIGASRSEADTPTLAICRAALQAVERE